MSSKHLIALTAALVFATSALASATVFVLPNGGYAQPDRNRPTTLAGIVHTDGSVAQGRGFLVSHPSTGIYVIAVSGNNRFPKCPSITVTSYTIPGTVAIPVIYSNQCGSGPVTVEVHMYTSGSKLEDNGFNFVMNET